MLFEDSIEAPMQSNAMIPDKSASIDHPFQVTVSIGFIKLEFVRFHRSTCDAFDFLYYKAYRR